MREVGEEHHRGQPEHLRIALQQHHRAERIGVRPVEARAAVARRERFGQHEQAVEEVQQRQAGGEPERQPQVDLAQHAADQRADDEAEAERRAEHAVAPGALRRLGDVGDVGVGGGEAGRGDRRDDAPHEQPRSVGASGHEHEVQAQPQAREQDHRAAAEPVRQRALDRRGDELDQREHGAERADPVGRGRGVAAGQLLDQVRQHRNDHAERQHVDQDRDEDEDERGAARRGRKSEVGHRVAAGRRDTHSTCTPAVARRSSSLPDHCSAAEKRALLKSLQLNPGVRRARIDHRERRGADRVTRPFTHRARPAARIPARELAW